MSLLLTGTKDHALLTMVVEEAHRAAESAGGYLGRTALQKVMYFLHTSGVPMGYRFELYHYGPYCDEITRDVEWLQADGVIADRSAGARYPNYAPGETAGEMMAQNGKEVERYRGQVRQIVQSLVPLRPDRLELLATLDYLFRWEKATGGDGPWKERVVQRFFKVKGQKFADDEVRTAYDKMASAGLLEA